MLFRRLATSVAIVALAVTPALAQQQYTPYGRAKTDLGPLVAVTGNQTLTSLSSSTALTVPAGASRAFATVDTGSDNIRCWNDGTAPTSTTGHEFVGGEKFWFEPGDLTKIHCIQENSGSNVSVQISYYK